MSDASMNVVAIVPIKPLSKAKSRLAPFLDRPKRQRLVVNMLRGVIKAALEAVNEVWVLGSDRLTEEIAKDEGANWRTEAGSDVNESLTIVFKEVWTSGRAPLFLPGDLPFLCGQDLRDLMAGAARQQAVVLSPANRGRGTNAILLPQPSKFRLLLGPNSFPRHVAEARRCGLEPSIHSTPGLANDLDTWDDAQAYQTMEPGLLERLTSGES